MLNEFFIKHSIKEAQIEDFIRSKFPLGDYSKAEIQRTPLGIKVVIWTNKPGKIIGRGGKTINEMTEALKVHFKLENPQLDVKIIDKPDLDPRIVAKQISSALERGYNHKKIGNLTVKRVMDAGAIGVEIIISGKIGGAYGRTEKFIEGFIKHCGQPAKELIDEGFEEANTKPGKIGVNVRIMKEFMHISGEKTTSRYEEPEEKPKEEAKPEEKKETKPKKKAKPKPKTEAKAKKPAAKPEAKAKKPKKVAAKNKKNLNKVKKK